MFKSPFSFEGRIRRTEYGLSILIYLVIIVIASVIVEAMEAPMLFFLALIPLLWFMFAQATKRCHDRGNSALYQFIPFYGLWMLFADSDPGINEYGPNPKGIGNTTEIDEIGNYL